MFEQTKQDVLGRTDNSKKGSIDEAIAPLVKAFNASDDFYTTSSCAGRITIMVEPKSGKKKDTEWLYVTHEQARLKDLLVSLANIPDETLWFRFEPFILHVCARSLVIADKLMKILAETGLKHSGILHVRKRVIVEIVGNERLDAPISHKGGLLVDLDYLQFLLETANKKMGLNREHIDRFRSRLVF